MTDPDPSPTPSHDRVPGRHPALPWQAVVAATVLALLAAGLVLVVASDNDDGATAADGGTPGDSLELRPADEVPSGDPLDIEFTAPDGSTATIRDQLGDAPLVVNFFASWCPPCIKEMPDFEAVSGDLGTDVDFLGLAVTDRPEDARRIVDETGITYPWARDVRGDIAGAVGVVQMPTTIFVSADGTVAEVHAGAVDQDTLRRLVAEHLGVTS